jgi:DNA-binding response OmpR family regulator
MKRILIVDDDVELCELLSEYLEPEGFEVESVHDGAIGVDRAVGTSPSIVVLDVMLPGLNGFEALQRIRAKCATPVVMLTARRDEVDRIVGLEMGADDYLPKPFNPRELVARIRAVLRRTAVVGHDIAVAGEGHAPLTIEDVTLDRGARSVRCAGLLVDLTASEFDLLELLLRGAGTIVTREDVARAVLGRHFNPFDRSVDMHVSRLRRKLGPRPDGLERIKSVRGSGYVYLLPHAGGSR